MSYKALMIHIDLDDDGGGRLQLAVELAGRFDAALIGVSAWAPSPVFGAEGVMIESVPEMPDLRLMEEVLKARGDKFRAAAGAAARPAQWRSALDLPTEFVLREIRAADLLIVGGTRHPVLRDPYR